MPPKRAQKKAAAADVTDGDASRSPKAAAKRRRTAEPRPTASWLEASPDGPLPPAGAWANAPADLLLPIFAAVPLRPRVLVLGTVCKRWRHLALSAPASLPRLRPLAIRGALSVLGDVRGMRDVPSTVVAPASVCDLSLEEAKTTVKVRNVAALSALTALTYDCDAVSEEVAAALLASSRTSLTSLTLLKDPMPEDVAAGLPARADLPALRSLTIAQASHGTAGHHWGSPEEKHRVLAFILPYAHQLTSLRLLHPACDARLWLQVLSHSEAVSALTALRHLHADASVPQLQTLLPKLPALTSLSLTLTLQWTDAAFFNSLPPSVALESLALRTNGYDRIRTRDALFEIAHKHTSLRALSVPCLRGSDCPALPMSLLTSLTVDELEPSLLLQYHFPALASLTLRKRLALSDVLKILSNMLSTPLRMRSVRVTVFAADLKGEALRSFGAKLKELEGRGVRSVCVDVDGGCAELRKLARSFLWLEVEVKEPPKAVYK